MLTGYVEPFFLIGMSMFSHSKKTYGVVTCLLVVFATAVGFIFSNCAIREIKNVSEEPAISGGDTFVIYRDRGVVLDVDAERRLVTVRVDSGSHSSLAGTELLIDYSEPDDTQPIQFDERLVAGSHVSVDYFPYTVASGGYCGEALIIE